MEINQFCGEDYYTSHCLTQSQIFVLELRSSASSSEIMWRPLVLLTVRNEVKICMESALRYSTQQPARDLLIY